MRKLLISLGVLAVLFVAADRVAAAIAENQISDRIAAAYQLSSKPRVSISGFPFLIQAVTGHYGQVSVSVSEVQADGATLRDLQVRFTGVHASLGQLLGHGPATVTADHAAGSATLAWGQLDRRLPPGLRARPDGKDALRVWGVLRHQGSRIPVSGTVSLGVTGSGIAVIPDSVSAAGASGPASAAYSSQLQVVVPLRTLPLHLHLATLRITHGGLRIGASAQNVRFTRA
jgi:LmeA-like phospholipid-binding